MNYKCKIIIKDYLNDDSPALFIILKYKPQNSLLYKEYIIDHWSIFSEDYQSKSFNQGISFREYVLNNLVSFNKLDREALMEQIKEIIIAKEKTINYKSDIKCKLDKEIKQLKNVFKDAFEVEV